MVKGDRSYELAWKDIDKYVRKIVLGFILFLMFTYAACKINYDAFLESMQLGFYLNVLLSPVYYRNFGDETEFKFKQI